MGHKLTHVEMWEVLLALKMHFNSNDVYTIFKKSYLKTYGFLNRADVKADYKEYEELRGSKYPVYVTAAYNALMKERLEREKCKHAAE